MLEQGEILLTLDGSSSSEVAIGPAVRLSQAFDAPLRVMHVVDSEDRSTEALDELPTERFRSYVRDAMARAKAADVSYETELAVGSPANTILDQAGNARLVVMATHGRGGFHATFIGSVTDKVVRAAKVPVLTIPVEGQPGLSDGPVIVSLDGSEEAEAALQPAREVASRLKLAVVLLRAYNPVVSTGSEFIVYEHDTVTILKEGAEAYLSSVAGEGEQIMAVMGNPALAIEEAARTLNAGLIVLTTRGRGLAGRLALGSTTDRVIHNVRHPILVIPR